MQELIVHISADYPDAVEPAKTRAIERLVSGTGGEFAQRIYSLNRRGGLGAIIGRTSRARGR